MLLENELEELIFSPVRFSGLSSIERGTQIVPSLRSQYEMVFCKRSRIINAVIEGVLANQCPFTQSLPLTKAKSSSPHLLQSQASLPFHLKDLKQVFRDSWKPTWLSGIIGGEEHVTKIPSSHYQKRRSLRGSSPARHFHATIPLKVFRVVAASFQSMCKVVHVK